MTSAELRGADLRGAEFQRAKLQGAHFDNAKLLGARFDQANLADTYFKDAELDDRVLRSMLNAEAETWRKVDAVTKKRLEEMDAKRTRPATNAPGTTPSCGGTKAPPQIDVALPVHLRG